MIKLLRQALWLVCAGFLAAAGSAGAQSAAGYPNKPVRVIIPFTAGGAVTTVMSALGDRVGKELGQNFIADYRPGGDTILGVSAVATSAPDGYTLAEATSSYLVNYWLHPDLPVNYLRDLTPVAMLARSNYVLAVHPSVPGTLKEFIAYAKANPAKMNMAYFGSVALLNWHMFMNASGVKVTAISYKGSAQAATDLLSGQVVANIGGLAAVQSLVKAGKLKAIAVTGDKRSAVLPEVPTFAEAGLKDFNPYNWFVLLAPAKTPRDIVDKLNGQFRRAQQAPEAIDMLDKINVEVFPTTVGEAEQYIRSQAAQYGKIIKEAAIKAESN